MDQLVNYITDINWGIVEQLFLLVVSLVMIALFKKNPLYTQKAIKIGAGVFIVAIIFNVIGLTAISDNITVFAFTIIVLALIRLFWSDTKV